MDNSETIFPSTAAEKEYIDAANNYKTDLRSLLESVSEYEPGKHSSVISEISTLLGKRKQESENAFDKFTGEVLAEIDEQPLIQQEKLLEKKGGGTGQ